MITPESGGTPKFLHAAFMQDARMLIKSTCQKCGESKIVSTMDGSLEEWLTDHQCSQTASMQF